MEARATINQQNNRVLKPSPTSLFSNLNLAHRLTNPNHQQPTPQTSKATHLQT